MPWMNLADSGLNYAADSRVFGTGDADLTGSEVHQYQGSPPQSANAAAWALLFYTADNGNTELKLRVTPLTLTYVGSNARPVLTCGLGSPFLGTQTQLEAFAVAENDPILVSIPPDAAFTYLCFAELQDDLEPVNSVMQIEVFLPSTPAVSDVYADLPNTVAGKSGSIPLGVTAFPEESGLNVDFADVEFSGMPSDWSVSYARLDLDEQVAVVQFPSGLAPGIYDFQYRGQYGTSEAPEFTAWAYVQVVILASTSGYNCECDDAQPTVTLKQMRERLARRLGFSVQVSMGALPPGMPELLDDFTRSAHELFYRRYSVMRLRRMFTWEMVPGVRFYDLEGNSDDCPRKLDPGKLEWVGISQGDSSWRPLVCGINPVLYGSHSMGIPSHYEIRQCIEVWPAPTDESWQLRIKGDFGMSPLDVDDDVLTVDPEAVFLQALANAKAHYGMADAANYASQATAYIRSLIAASHQTRRYVPGGCVPAPAVRPLLKES
ncbi:hypothetical protein D3C81_702330 [compost metagenome]